MKKINNEIPIINPDANDLKISEGIDLKIKKYKGKRIIWITNWSLLKSIIETEKTTKIIKRTFKSVL